MNKVLLMGNITRDLEIKQTMSGKSFVNTGLAVSKKYKYQGEEREETCFVDITIWNKQAEAAAKKLKKGSKVFVEGALKYHSWEKDGQKRSKLDVVCQSITFMDSKQGEASEDNNKRNSDSYYGGSDDIPF